jgi:hypothetical protein
MANRSRAGSRRWGARAVARIALMVVFGVLLSYVEVQLWTARSDDLAVLAAERQGVAYLKPVLHLVDELTVAQSAAVRGGQVDTAAVQAAIEAVDAVDGRLGASLGTRQRWSDLREQISTAITQRLSGEPGYRTYTGVVAVAVDLCRKAGDTSQLILDPELDSYYLMDTALLRVPDILVAAGRAADLAVLAGQAPSEAARTRVSVARYQVAVASDAVGVGLRKALESTDSATLGPGVTGKLDAFRSAVDAFVPPATLLQTLDTVDAATIGRSADAVRQAVGPLADSVLAELDVVLRARESAIGGRRTAGVVTGAAGLLIALVLLWLLLPGVPRPQPARRDQADAETTFVDPRDLLPIDELLYAGRPVSIPRQGRSGDES